MWQQIESDRVGINLGDRRLFFGRRFDLGGGSLRAAGAVERAPAAFPDSLSPTALLRWLRDAGSWRGHATAEGLPVAPLVSLVPSAFRARWHSAGARSGR